MSKYEIACSYCDGTGKIQVDWIGHRRKELGLTQEEVAKVLKIQRTQVSNIERGYSGLSSDKILIYADLLRVSASELLEKMHGKEVVSDDKE